ncbi:MAG: helix-turn-helix domain-containing protein [Acidimicrobiia bacterium]
MHVDSPLYIGSIQSERLIHLCHHWHSPHAHHRFCAGDPGVRRNDYLISWTNSQCSEGALGVPVATIYAWRYRREGPPGFKVGKHVRYRWRDVEEWIERQLQDAARGQSVTPDRYGEVPRRRRSGTWSPPR